MRDYFHVNSFEKRGLEFILLYLTLAGKVTN